VSFTYVNIVFYYNLLKIFHAFVQNSAKICGSNIDQFYICEHLQ